MIVALPVTVAGPVLVRGNFTIGGIPLKDFHVRADESVTLDGAGTVVVVELPADHAIDRPFDWGFRP